MNLWVAEDRSRRPDSPGDASSALGVFRTGYRFPRLVPTTVLKILARHHVPLRV